MRFVQNLFVGAVYLSLAACAPESPLPPDDDDEGVTDVDRDGIVGGKPSAALPAVGALTRFGGLHCTGTLVAPRKVLTAAHCLQGVSASSLRFVIGPSVGQAQAVIRVASVTPHPDFDPFELVNDIGFVTLTQDAPVAPMGLLPAMDASWEGRELVFVGYGASNGVTQSGGGLKRSVTMTIAEVGASQFAYATPGKNTCNGDSGGPAFAQVGAEQLVAGVTSFGDATCKQFGVDTRVDVFASFVGAGGGCQGETFEGRCDGTTVVWCEDAQVKTLSCQTCGFDQAQGFFNCL